MAFFERPGRDSDIRLSVIDSVCRGGDGGPAGETKAEALRLDFDRRLRLQFHGSVITYGAVLNALLNFVIVAAVIFFLVIKPVNALMARMGRTPSEDPVRECPECLSKVPDLASRCAYCTSTLTPIAG